MPYKWPIFIAAALTPMFIWALLTLYSRKHPGILSTIYPWLRNLCIVFWIASVVLVAVYLGSTSSALAPLCSSVFVFCSGLNLLHAWVRRRVDPEYEGTRDGWWPSPKKW
jgi:uncharacterized protein involved in cysteine biosynthesis